LYVVTKILFLEPGPPPLAPPKRDEGLHGGEKEKGASRSARETEGRGGLASVW
jgi:hypothetical protein